ncbi:MAG TPA: hypothetical protein VLI04_10875 [Nocardioidaceae bacterium]|nr:hypothetical protein [Nocardioidaceae bacterium]
MSIIRASIATLSLILASAVLSSCGSGEPEAPGEDELGVLAAVQPPPDPWRPGERFARLPGERVFDDAESPARQSMINGCLAAIGNADNPEGSSLSHTFAGWPDTKQDGFQYGAYAEYRASGSDQRLMLEVIVRDNDF